MTPLWTVAASDALLAATTAWVSMQAIGSSLPKAIRWGFVFSLISIGLAACLGALRFGGLDTLSLWHQALADQAAIIGMPLLLACLSAHYLRQRIPSESLITILAGLLISCLLFQLRIYSGAICLLLLIATVSISTPRSKLFQLLGCVGLLATLRAVPMLPDSWRFSLLHLVLCGLVLIAWAALQQTTHQQTDTTSAKEAC